MYSIDFEWNQDYLYLKLERLEKQIDKKILEYKYKANANIYERNHFGRWDYYINVLGRIHQEKSEIRQKYIDKLKTNIILPNLGGNKNVT